jgi:hypothetical protein
MSQEEKFEDGILGDFRYFLTFVWQMLLGKF